MNSSKFIFIALFSTLLVSCSNDEIEVVVGKKTFIIPTVNISTVAQDYVEERKNGWDSSELAFSVRWSPNQIIRDVPNYEAYRTNNGRNVDSYVYAQVYYFNKNKLDFVKKGKSYLDAYYLRGKYFNAEIENNNGLYFVYERDRSVKAWSVLSCLPNGLPHKPIYKSDFWHGTCTNYLDGYGNDCDIEFVYEDLYLRVNILGTNIFLIEEIKEFVTRQLNHWQRINGVRLEK